MGLLIGIGRSNPESPYDHYYGIEWDVAVSNPKCKRIGKPALHASLPIHSMMRRCVLRDSGSIAYYLDPNDSTKKADGTKSNLDGTDGQVMVEVPTYYARFEVEGNKRRCLLSPFELPGFHKWERCFVSAYEATIQRSTNKLSSVVNKTADYRGGDNDASKDGHFNSQLGRPASKFNLTQGRGYARNRGSIDWNCYAHEVHKRLFWLFAVEYATFNSQEKFTAQLSPEGYRQGGLGNGVTDLADWNLFGFLPLVPCGVTNQLGDRTGVVFYSCQKDDTGSNYQTLHVPSYRGVENPFGHIWTLTDGAKCLIQSDSDGATSGLYVSQEKDAWGNSGIIGYELKGLIPRVDGYIQEVIGGESGEVIPLSVGGGSTAYFCDRFYTGIPGTGSSERIFALGGDANIRDASGLMCCRTAWTGSNSYSNAGTRLCFIP